MDHSAHSAMYLGEIFSRTLNKPQESHRRFCKLRNYVCVSLTDTLNSSSLGQFWPIRFFLSQHLKYSIKGKKFLDWLNDC